MISTPPLRHRVDRQLALAAAAQLTVLAALGATAGLGPLGWLVGTAYMGALWILLAGAARRAGSTTLGPADLITLARSVLVGGVAALVAQGIAGGVTPGERANAELKSWKILRKIRSSPCRSTTLVKAVQTLILAG